MCTIYVYSWSAAYSCSQAYLKVFEGYFRSWSYLQQAASLAEKMANRLFGYVDADHAADKDDRKSVTVTVTVTGNLLNTKVLTLVSRRCVGGHVLILNGGAICWASRKIKVVA
jgi:hypothetical protein